MASVYTSTAIELKFVLTKESFDSVKTVGTFKASEGYEVLLGTEFVSFCIRLYPNGSNVKNEGRISIFVRTLNPIKIHFNKIVQLEMYIKTANTLKMKLHKVCKIQGQEMNVGHGWPIFCDRSDFIDIFKNCDTITVVAKLMIPIDHQSANALMKDMTSIRSFDSYSDFTVICGERKFLCHKVILAARSTVLRTMLEAEMKEKNANIMEIKDSTPEIVEMLINHIYKDELPENLNDVATDLMHLSVKYDLPNLTRACEESIVSSLSIDTALSKLITIDTYIASSTSSSRKAVLEYIAANFELITYSKYWEVFAKQHTNLMSEVARFAVKKSDCALPRIDS